MLRVLDFIYKIYIFENSYTDFNNYFSLTTKFLLNFTFKKI